MASAAPGRSILVIEDDEIARAGIAAVLGREGYLVALAANGQEALDYLRGGSTPCLILLDMMMPAMDGWEFIKRRRQDAGFQAIPVLVTTALGIAGPDWAEALGACGILRKPIAAEDLLAEVRRWCP